MAAWLVAGIAAYYLLQALLPVLVCGLIGWGVWRWVMRNHQP
jgi:hypothetical protein